MKRIIDNIEYDKTNATYIDGYTVRLSHSEAHEVEAYLYRTPSGEYFEGIFGGEQTEYAAGEIKPLTAAAARAWLAEHRSPARAEEVFGSAEPMPEGITLTLNIPLAAAAEIAAAIVSALPALDIAPLRGALRELISHGI